MTAPTTADVATMALEAVMRGEVDEAAALIGQLNDGDREALCGYIGTLLSLAIMAESVS